MALRVVPYSQGQFFFYLQPDTIPMATAKELYKKLFGGERVKVGGVGSKKEYEVLRVMLHKEHQISTMLDMSNESLCGIWHSDAFVAEFWLGPSRRQKVRQWEVVSDETRTDKT